MGLGWLSANRQLHIFFYGNGNINHYLETCFIHKGVIISW
jgi:hypothetical protein